MHSNLDHQFHQPYQPHRILRPTLFSMLLVLCSAQFAVAGEAEGTKEFPGDYREPSAAVTALLTAPTPPEPLLHARSGQLALLFREPVISMARLARPRLGLAGFRFDPESRTSGVGPLIQRIEIMSALAPATQQPVQWLPASNAVLDFVKFSPDGQRLSALSISRGPARLVIFDLATGTERQLDAEIQPAWGDPCRWVSNEELLCRVIPGNRGTPPMEQPAPVVLEHMGAPIPMRTPQNLLDSAYEDALFEYYFDAELVRLNVAGSKRPVPNLRGLVQNLEPSPDGNYAVITRIQRPFSRMVRASRFPSVIELWDLAKGERLYASSPSGFGIDEGEGDEANQGPRRFTWMPGASSTLGFVEKSRDADGKLLYRWMAISAPFIDAPVEVTSSAKLFHRFGWSTAGTAYFSTLGETSAEVSYQVVLNGDNTQVWQGVAADRYDNPGRALRLDGADGPALEADGRIFIAGDGLSDQGPRPFLDVFDLKQQKVQRVFQAEPGVYEVVLGVLDPKLLSFVTSRETETESPQFYLHRGKERIALPQVPDPFPQLVGASRQVLTYPRADGVALSGTLYLPAGHVKGQPLPTLVWIYPTEFADTEQAEQMDLRFFRFHKVKGASPLAAVVAGYAVLLNPTVPIIHEGGDTSDDYLPQLIASVEAAVDHLVSTGVSDPAKIAVAGRSYGAFSTANLMIHSDLFATGIAMSGAYNRTLTPFGFQHERRSFWEATDYYTSISPFFFANKLERPLLLMHGGSDENPGTLPFGARRFFHALLGEGAPARYVELPYEGHHYWARENVLFAAAEMLDWMERWIGPGVAAPGGQ